ncbi:MAG: SPOR domain-containing protein [Synergistaceae bacterium]|nr:SPOR domain-containing protein [Synergistaceae bacterium]
MGSSNRIFSSRGSAESLRQQVSKSGHSTSITTAIVGGKTFYRVTVAAGKERSSAVSLSAKLKKAGYPVFVVEVR